MERSSIDRVSGRLRAALRGALAGLPPEHRGGSGLSRLTGVERTTCQRVTAALTKSETNDDFLRRLPGTRGLESFAAGLRRADIADEKVVAIESAVRDFARLIASSTRSKLAFDRLVASGDPVQARPSDAPVSPGTFARAREEHFWSACGIAGRWSELGVSVQLMGPVPDDTNSLELASARGHFGHSARPSAVPFALHGGIVDWDVGDDAEPRPLLVPLGVTSEIDGERISLGMIDSLTTKPLPELTPRHGSNVLTYAVDPADLAVDTPIDLVVAQRSAAPMSHPATHEDPIHLALYQVDFPIRRLIFDFYLHKTMAMSSLATLSSHVFGLHLDLGPNAWLTRLPFGPRLQVLGPWSTISPGEDDHAALETARQLFAAIEWEPRDFVGYRCDVAYPVWRACYMMQFDFGREG